MARPRKSNEERLVEVPCKVPVEIAELIDGIASATDRSRSQVARKLISRGVAAYSNDGLLDEPVPLLPITASPVPTPAARQPEKPPLTPPLIIEPYTEESEKV